MNIEDIEIKREPVIVFMGTPDFSVAVLDALIKNYKVKAVVTQPDKYVGRDNHLAKPPVKILAEENNIVVLQLDKIKEQYNQVIELEPDIIITCAYGQILPKELLDYPKYGCINVHASCCFSTSANGTIKRRNGITNVLILNRLTGCRESQ